MNFATLCDFINYGLVLFSELLFHFILQTFHLKTIKVFTH